MSYFPDFNGLDLFNTPFSTPAKQPQQVQPMVAKQNVSATQPPKSPQPARQMADTKQKPLAAPQPNPAPAATAPTKKENPASSVQTQTNSKKPEPAVPPKAPASTQPAKPKKELVLDMSSGSGAVPVQDDTEKRKAHEEAETKRKAEWEAKQKAKKQAEEAAIQKLQTMSDEDAIAASVKRISTDTERLTRRNMKECVAEHIQELCRKDIAFARRTMHPRKNMIRCFKYVTRMARDYVKQEMEDNDIKPDRGGYGCDVPDGLCYQWAEDYFNSTDALEDQEKEEKFVPKPYTGTSAKPAKKVKKAENKPKKQESKPSNGYEQMSLEGVI